MATWKTQARHHHVGEGGPGSKLSVSPSVTSLPSAMNTRLSVVAINPATNEFSSGL